MGIQVPLEENRRLEEALLDYLTEVDNMDDLDALVACFTEDAVLDLSGLDLGVYNGSDGIRGFFGGVLAFGVVRAVRDGAFAAGVAVPPEP